MATREEIRDSREVNLLAFVQAYRPQWLRPMNSAGARPGTIAVYMDGMRIGGPEALREISSGIVTDLRYVDGLDAVARWGVGHSDGAIVITSRLAMGRRRPAEFAASGGTVDPALNALPIPATGLEARAVFEKDRIAPVG